MSSSLLGPLDFSDPANLQPPMFAGTDHEVQDHSPTKSQLKVNIPSALQLQQRSSTAPLIKSPAAKMVDDGGSETSQQQKIMGKQGELVKSWADMVQGKRELKKYDMEVKVLDGMNTVDVPDEVFEDASPLWEDFLIGRFG